MFFDDKWHRITYKCESYNQICNELNLDVYKKITSDEFCDFERDYLKMTEQVDFSNIEYIDNKDDLMFFYAKPYIFNHSKTPEKDIEDQIKWFNKMNEMTSKMNLLVWSIVEQYDGSIVLLAVYYDEKSKKHYVSNYDVCVINDLYSVSPIVFFALNNNK